MVCMYLFVGGILLFTEYLPDLNGIPRTLLGVGFVGYSLYRAYTVYLRYKGNQL